MRQLAVLGGMNMDLVVRAPAIPRPGETLQGAGFGRYGGGKGANQALAAARLGARVELLGQVGTDAFGDELVEGLRREGVGTGGVRRLPGHPTGVAFIVVAATGENAIVVAPGANMAWDAPALPPAAARLFVANLEVPASVVAAAVRAARRAGARVVLNPAPYSEGGEGCFPDVDVLVPNQIEAAGFAGADAAGVGDWAEVGRRLLALGPRAVVLTLGSAGALVVEPAGVVRVPGHRVPVVDTTAAGDAFVGGLAAALLRGAPLSDAARYANACGALAVTRAGAQPSLPTAEAVEQLLAEPPHR